MARNPYPTVAANVAAATVAARHCRVSIRYTMKMPGVSLKPAASPIPMPFSQERSGSAMSASTRTISTALTWPNAIVCWTGSSQRTSAPSTSARPSRPAVRRWPAMPSASHADRPIAATVAIVSSQRAAPIDRPANALQTVSAHGV